MKAQYTVTVGSETIKQDIKALVANIKHRTGADQGRILKDALSDYYIRIKAGLSARYVEPSELYPNPKAKTIKELTT